MKCSAWKSAGYDNMRVVLSQVQELPLVLGYFLASMERTYSSDILLHEDIHTQIRFLFHPLKITLFINYLSENWICIWLNLPHFKMILLVHDFYWIPKPDVLLTALSKWDPEPIAVVTPNNVWRKKPTQYSICGLLADPKIVVTDMLALPCWKHSTCPYSKGKIAVANSCKSKPLLPVKHHFYCSQNGHFHSII